MHIQYKLGFSLFKFQLQWFVELFYFVGTKTSVLKDKTNGKSCIPVLITCGIIPFELESQWSKKFFFLIEDQHLKPFYLSLLHRELTLVRLGFSGNTSNVDKYLISCLCDSFRQFVDLPTTLIKHNELFRLGSHQLTVQRVRRSKIIGKLFLIYHLSPQQLKPGEQ